MRKHRSQKPSKWKEGDKVYVYTNSYGFHYGDKAIIINGMKEKNSTTWVITVLREETKKEHKVPTKFLQKRK